MAAHSRHFDATALKFSAAVLSTLKLQNSKVIRGSHHVDELVEEKAQISDNKEYEAE